MAKRLIIAVVLALGIILPGLALTPTTVTTRVEPVAAHPSDCPVTVNSVLDFTADGKIGITAKINCHSDYYRLTVYACGGINGNGYCTWVGEGKCSMVVKCSSLYVDKRCTKRYSGSYWTYGGAKLDRYNILYDRWEQAKWVFGPGKYVAGSC